ncbi:MAG: response regulator [Planctomycetes bacterium]|nr:response regulator [Planctomycetota bacterium]
MTEQRTILVVDDDRELRHGLQTLLEKHGFRALTAEDGREAQERIDNDRPDLVIMDLMMPRLGGFPVLQHFRGQAHSPPFIMITANEQQQCKIAAEKAGAADFIRKPFSLRRLLEGVHRALEQQGQESADTETPPAASIRCSCPACGARIRAAVHLLGQTHSCPACKQALLVRPLPPSDQGPVLALDDEISSKQPQRDFRQ